MTSRIVVLCAVAAAACGGGGDGGPAVPSEAPVGLEAVGALTTTADVGAEIAGPSVRVRGARGGALSGVTVTCSVISGASTLSAANATSGSDGTATCGRWTLPQQPGATSTQVAIVGIDTLVFAVNVRAGPPFQLAFERGLVGDVFSGMLVDPQPIVVLQDRFGNRATSANVSVTARTDVPSIVIYGGSTLTTSSGRAEFSRLGFAGPPVPFVLTFDATGLQSVSATQTSLQPAPPGAATPARLEFRIVGGGPKVMVIDPAQRANVPPLDAFNTAGFPLPFALTQLAVRSPSLVGISGDTSMTALATGRTFVVAQSVAEPTVADSLLVYVAQSAAGPLLRTDFPGFSVQAGTDIEVRVLVDMRASGALAGASVDVAYPRSSPALLSLLLVTSAPGTTTTTSPTSGLVRIAYTNATGASGVTELARLRFRANFSSPNLSQLVLTPVQIVSATLQDVTLTTTAMNPPFVVRQ